MALCTSAPGCSAAARAHRARAGPHAAAHACSRRARAARIGAGGTAVPDRSAYTAATQQVKRAVNPRLRRAAVILAATNGAAGENSNRTNAPTPAPPRCVWFKHDLRTDDNPALAAAARPGDGAAPVAGIYVLDPALVARSAPGACGAAALSGALRSLRAGLRARGSDLWIVSCEAGEGAADALARVVKKLGPGVEVHAEEEALAGWACAVSAAAAALSAASATLTTHRTPMHAATGASDNWKAHRKGRGPRLPPLADIGALPAPGKGLAAALGPPGALPTPADLVALASAASPVTALASTDGAPWPPATAAAADDFAALGISSFGAPEPAAAAAAEIAAGGEAAARAALAAYLGSAAPGRQRADATLAAAVKAGAAAAETPGTPGGSFPALFGPALALGTLSRRRVASDAAAALARLPPFPAVSVPLASAHPRAAAAAAEAADFYWAQAAARAGKPAAGGASASVATLRHWRWRGVLTEYVECLPSAAAPDRFSAADDEAAPAILLIHGFGAFGEQYRGQVAGLASAGFRVYAPSLPGYGRSEKAPLPYGQDAWSGFAREFTQAVIRAPVVAAGNSIGGYIVAALAADAPRSVAGVVLLNPAGRVDGLAAGEAAGGGAPVQRESPASPPPNRLFVEAVSRALFTYLELSIGRTLKRLYPTNPAAADAWLAGEIGRAAADPGALSVFQSVFYMPKPRALDALIARDYAGPTLILQGALDPLNDARRRAADLLAACPNAQLVLLDAGHCPHDEVPDRVTDELAAFARRCFGRREEGGGGHAAQAQQRERREVVGSV